ncbi:MAG: hypothetical protein IIC71_12775 [Acidobacteria bacterium]|nr:hypothetical protein [Acidobacteriota bacterium]
MIRRFLRFLIEDSYPIGFLSGIVIARSFWFPCWGYGPAVYVLALLTLARLATPQITARMAIKTRHTPASTDRSTRRHARAAVATHNPPHTAFATVGMLGRVITVAAASASREHLGKPPVAPHLGLVPSLRQYRGEKPLQSAGPDRQLVA